MASKVKGNAGVVGAVVNYWHSQAAAQQTTTDASGNHTSQGFPVGKVTVTAVDPAGLRVFNSVVVPIDGANDASDVNLRSRLVNASNAIEGGF
jgi:hypothetical protein